MEFSEVILQRRSVRTFSDRPVEDSVLEYVLEAARRAPSACNNQPARFVVVRDPELLEVVGRPKAVLDGKFINRWLAKAPVIIVPCGERAKTPPQHDIQFWQVDAAIAAEHLVLAAVDAGLGTCWVGLFDEPTVRGALGIPVEFGIVGLLALGYPADRMTVTERMTRAYNRADKRKPLADLASVDGWQRKLAPT